jgi:hypothetical protein
MIGGGFQPSPSSNGQTAPSPSGGSCAGGGGGGSCAAGQGSCASSGGEVTLQQSKQMFQQQICSQIDPGMACSGGSGGGAGGCAGGTADQALGSMS